MPRFFFFDIVYSLVVVSSYSEGQIRHFEGARLGPGGNRHCKDIIQEF